MRFETRLSPAAGSGLSDREHAWFRKAEAVIEDRQSSPIGRAATIWSLAQQARFSEPNASAMLLYEFGSMFGASLDGLREDAQQLIGQLPTVGLPTWLFDLSVEPALQGVAGLVKMGEYGYVKVADAVDLLNRCQDDVSAFTLLAWLEVARYCLVEDLYMNPVALLLQERIAELGRAEQIRFLLLTEELKLAPRGELRSTVCGDLQADDVKQMATDTVYQLLMAVRELRNKPKGLVYSAMQELLGRNDIEVISMMSACHFHVDCLMSEQWLRKAFESRVTSLVRTGELSPWYFSTLFRQYGQARIFHGPLMASVRQKFIPSMPELMNKHLVDFSHGLSELGISEYALIQQMRDDMLPHIYESIEHMSRVFCGTEPAPPGPRKEVVKIDHFAPFAWALAVQDTFERGEALLPVWLERGTGLMDSADELSDALVMQLHQASLSQGLLLPEHVATRARALVEASRLRPPGEGREEAEYLRVLKLALPSEVEVVEAFFEGYHLDWCVRYRGQLIDFEYDGNSFHLIRNATDGGYLHRKGKDLLRDRILARAGYRVIRTLHSEFSILQSDSEKIALIRSGLE